MTGGSATLHWFETDVLAEERNYQGLTQLNADLVQQPMTRSSSRRMVLDIDSSESPVYGTQEQSAYNGHFESVCYHSLFVFNAEGDCLAAKLRQGNVHSAERRDEILLPIIDRYRRRDAAFARPEIYAALECRGVRYAIRLPANDVLERVRFIATTLTGTNRTIVRFYNQRGTAEQWIKEGKTATHWTRLSCHQFRANEVRLLLGVIAYNLGNLLRRLVLPLAIQSWTLTSLQQRLFKTGGRLIRHARYFTLQLAESYLTSNLFRQILARIEQRAWHLT